MVEWGSLEPLGARASWVRIQPVSIEPQPQFGPEISVGADDDLDTPALVVDLERLERNLERWQRFCVGLGMANRPHIKTHRTVEVARMQVELGAVGITCQKLGEAEVMVAAGITDILVPCNILGPKKLERLASLLSVARITVSVDDTALLPGLAGAAREDQLRRRRPRRV